MNTSPLNDTDYDIFRTAEEKKVAEPKLATDEFFSNLSREWKTVGKGFGNDEYETGFIYRRRKPSSPQYPRWVKCGEMLEGTEYELALNGTRIGRGYYFSIIDGNRGEWRHSETNVIMQPQPTHLFERIIIPPPPKVEEKKDEFEEWFDKALKEQNCLDSEKAFIRNKWAFKVGFNAHAALVSKESKKGGGE